MSGQTFDIIFRKIVLKTKLKDVLSLCFLVKSLHKKDVILKNSEHSVNLGLLILKKI